MTEFARRWKRIYDPEEFKAAMAWVKERCHEGEDQCVETSVRSAEGHRLGVVGQDGDDRP